MREGAVLAKNFLNYLVPENPLYDLMNNIIPAVAAFGLIFGVALMYLEKKEPILSTLERSTELIEKILVWLAILSPISIFTHIAVVFGTVYFEEVASLAFYSISFISVTLILTLWVFPVLLSSLTPLKYGEVMQAFKVVCLLPFATALPTLALPFIIIYMKKLGRKYFEGNPEFHSTSQTVLPICYSFGQIGNSLILFFILFLSFYYRHPFDSGEKAVLSIFILPMSFGSSTASFNVVSFLIEQLGFPGEATTLFHNAAAITMNFQALVSSASIFTFVILLLYACYGALKIQKKRLIAHFGAIFIVFVITVGISKRMLHLHDSFHRQFLDHRIEDVIRDPVSATAHETPPPIRPTPSEGYGHIFQRILRSGLIRVGYSILDIPYCYLNQKGELVGYDIAYAYQLARDLDCRLEFIPLSDYQNIAQQIEDEEVDVIMSAVIMDERRITTMEFTEPYNQQDFVLVVARNSVSQFFDLKKMIAAPDLKVGAYGEFSTIAKRRFPLAQIQEIPHLNAEQFLDIFLKKQVDMVFWSRPQAFVWCLTHPEFVAVDYGEALGSCYFAYPVKIGATPWVSFLNHWLNLKTQDGFQQRMTEFWLEGKNPDTQAPRWSVIRNVLHWIK